MKVASGGSHSPWHSEEGIKSFKKVVLPPLIFKNGGGGDAMQSKKVLVEVGNFLAIGSWLEKVEQSPILSILSGIGKSIISARMARLGLCYDEWQHQIFELLSSYCVVFRSRIN